MIFILDIKPMAKQSTRFTKTGHAYQPADVVNYHNYLKLVIREQMLKAEVQMLDRPVRVKILAIWALPKSAKKSDRDFVGGGFTLPKSTKPDVDNLMKATLDPLNGLLWRDDALICEAAVSKRWGANNQLIIQVEEL